MEKTLTIDGKSVNFRCSGGFLIRYKELTGRDPIKDIYEMGEMLERVLTILRYSIDMFSHNNREHMEEILDLEEHIDEMERQYQQSHVDRLTRNECTPEAGMIFSDVISGLERVADHATNIAFSILDEDQE